MCVEAKIVVSSKKTKIAAFPSTLHLFFSYFSPPFYYTRNSGSRLESFAFRENKYPIFLRQNLILLRKEAEVGAVADRLE